MAEGSVNFLLTKLSEILGREGGLLRGVDDDAEHIKFELENMKAFLRAADAVEFDDSRLKIMVKKVAGLAHEMEDTLDDFRLCLVRDPRQEDGKFSGLIKLAFALKTLFPRHRIASKLRSIRARVKILGEQQRTYSDQNTELMRLGSTSTNTRPPTRPIAVPLDADLVGVENHKKWLIEQLLGDEAKRYVVTVVGMGGLGKSTLAKMVYDDVEIMNQFKFRAWITVSQSYKIEDLLKNVHQQLCKVLIKSSEPQGMDNMNHEMLRTAIGELLNLKTYLIVLDDVWDTKVWDEFRDVLPNESSRSRVMFTTRKEAIAYHSCREAYERIYELSPLSNEDSRKLFDRKLFKNGTCPSNLREVTEKFLSRCEGLPLAIDAITGVLSRKDIGQLDEWKMVDNSLGDALEDNDDDGLESLKNILSLSYNDLPYYLKSCLLYLSFFPLGNTIERMRIIRLWVAEGFVKERTGMVLEEVADFYLNELIGRSLVKVVEMTNDGRVKTCRIHDILREIMISKAKDQVFAAIVKDKDKLWPEKVRRLSIHNASASIQQRQIGSHSRLRSLLMFWGIQDSPTLELPLRRLRFLNVLHLEGAPLTKFPRHVVSLFLLKYLSLRGTKVDSIPTSIDKLQNLETLDMKHTLVTELPDCILKLLKLRHLLVYRYIYETDDQVHTKCGFKSPVQIGKLQSLQKLCFLEADQGEKLLMEIGTLIHLRRLGIVKLSSADGKVLCSSICKLINLRALSVTADSEHELISMDHLSSPPPFLRRLYLTGRLERLPDWISSLQSLKKLVLKWSRLSVSDDPLSPLQDLPNLVHFAFVQAYDGEVLRFKTNGFQKLKFLGLNRLEKLNSVVLEEGAVACLEKLVVHSCNCLHKLPLGIEHLASLKELEFFDMPQELASSLRDTENINHVQTVHFVDRYDGLLNKYDFKS